MNAHRFESNDITPELHPHSKLGVFLLAGTIFLTADKYSDNTSQPPMIEVIDQAEEITPIFPDSTIEISSPTTLNNPTPPETYSDILPIEPPQRPAHMEIESTPTPTIAKPTRTPRPEIKNDTEIIAPSAPTNVAVINKDGSTLLEAYVVPGEGTFTGDYDVDGAPIYDIDPQVAQSQGDNGAEYFAPRGRPNTLPKNKEEGYHQDDDSVYILSHSSNLPGIQLAFQALNRAEVGGLVIVTTDKGIFEYQIIGRESIYKPDLIKDEALWQPDKGLLYLITCVPNSEGVPADKEKNTVVTTRLVKATSVK